MKAYKNHDKHSELKLFLSIIVSSEVIDYLIILLQKHSYTAYVVSMNTSKEEEVFYPIYFIGLDESHPTKVKDEIQSVLIKFGSCVMRRW